MNGLIPIFDIIKPLPIPIKTPKPIPTKIAKITGIPLAISIAAIAPVKPTVEPTDISKPPETIKTVIPIAMILSIDRLKRVARIFPEVKNIGDNIVIRITAPIIINKIMNS